MNDESTSRDVVIRDDSKSEMERPYIVPAKMSHQTFCRFKEFVTIHLGIKMPDTKQTMLQSRLQKRLRILGLASYEEYYDYVFSARGMETELSHMIDAVTTNKTDFFREPKHFKYLEQFLLPDLLKKGTAGGSGAFQFWSAGCSTGAEPYSLAMLLNEFAICNPGFRFEILATDISQRVLEEALTGIYTESMVAPIPVAMRRKYLLKSKDSQKQKVRIVPQLRKKIVFGRLNFIADDLGLRRMMDVIFCRNVMIYFDRPTQEQVVNRLCRYLNPGGHLFVGHSESLNGLNVPLVQVSPTIYRRLENI